MKRLSGKKVLITSGGTLEKWDAVRGHTNLARGTMGCLLAEAALERGAEVLYLHGYFAKLPEHHAQMRCYSFEGIEDLGAQIRTLLQEERVDVVIMAAAVSDWVVDQIMDQEGRVLLEQGKMPSDTPPLIRFKKAPKILGLIKTWQPDVLLIGFKLEHNTDLSYLIERSMRQNRMTGAAYTVANGASALYGSETAHCIVSQTGDVREFPDKRETAEALLQIVADELQKEATR